ncbi:MAG: GNAT family N-acetyltransferase [Candidatus Eisenbacteria bacterium]|uniref:GNAT family N-acetyltransferase n=1 Tax=Eiseniibacteriota bacterium TaxID=2212470 RepID=A0A933SI29_UNCEI|nr:GNAT family N-acetyltransferase [Candidatus Eisenbacteria bacterium]
MTLPTSPPAPTIERLAPADVPDVLTFLDADPVTNVYLMALVLRDALARPKDEYWAARRQGRITALLYLGGHSGAVLPAGDDVEGAAALGTIACERRASLPSRFQVIGPALMVRALLARFPGEDFGPRLVREQSYLSLSPGRLPAFTRLPELRHARREDYALVYETGAALRAEELLEDPREVDAIAYARRAEEDCRDGHMWVWRDSRGLCFRSSISALTADAAQISGVYTPPALRGQGIATRALAELCTRLLDRSQHACLFVNDVNTSALSLYRRLGFEHRAAWMSAFFVREN